MRIKRQEKKFNELRNRIWQLKKGRKLVLMGINYIAAIDSHDMILASHLRIRLEGIKLCG